MPKTKALAQGQRKPAPAPTEKRLPERPAKAASPSRSMMARSGAALTSLPGAMTTGAVGRARRVEALQRTLGNARLGQMAAEPPMTAPTGGGRKPPIQPKLAVGPADDPFEREADQAAGRIAAGQPVGRISRLPACGSATQRKCAACAEEEGKMAGTGAPVQRAAGPVESGLDTEQAERAMARAGPGSPIAPAMRMTMEQGFGADFSGVRVHTGPAADEASRAVNARAFTRGSDIYLARGESASDHRLMGHELTHVVQQRLGRLPPQVQTRSILLGQPDMDRTVRRKSDILPAAPANVEIQRNPDGAAEEQEAIGRMEQDIEVAENLLRQDLTEEDQRRIQQAITNARERLRHYREVRDQGQARTATMASIGLAAGAILADDATGIGVADDPLLILAGLAAIATLIFTRPPAGQDAVADAWRRTGEAFGELASTIETIVWMTAAGNVIHQHLVDEARQLAIALGLAASASQVTREMLCDMLSRMADQNRRIDTEKWKKIISTMKGLGCRRSRAGR